MDIDEIRISRKTVIAGAGVGLAAAALAACSSGDSGESAPSEAPAEPSAPAAAEALTTTADVPVGAGVVVGEVIVTQPVAGDFKGFSSVCTHAGCRIDEVSGGTINCQCHGSKFSLDGAVVNGPAARPLDPVPVTVQGDSIVRS